MTPVEQKKRTAARADRAQNIATLESAIAQSRKREGEKRGAVTAAKDALTVATMHLVNHMKLQAVQSIMEKLQALAPDLIDMAAAETLQTDILGKRFAVPGGSDAMPIFNGKTLAEKFLTGLSPRIKPSIYELENFTAATELVTKEIKGKLK